MGVGWRGVWRDREFPDVRSCCEIDLHCLSNKHEQSVSEGGVLAAYPVF